MERFRTTVFVVLFHLPLIPTGTFLVEGGENFSLRPNKVLKRLPLDWEQVLKVWIVMCGNVLALIVAFKLIPFLPWK